MTCTCRDHLAEGQLSVILEHTAGYRRTHKAWLLVNTGPAYLLLWGTGHLYRVGSWCGVSLPKLVHHGHIREHLHTIACKIGCTTRPPTKLGDLFVVQETSLRQHRHQYELLQPASLPAIHPLYSCDSFELMDRCAQSHYTGLCASLKDLLWRGLQVAP